MGPGGALGALVARHPGAVHHLRQNRRQHDPDERKALEGLRDGDVADAVNWYVDNGRVHAIRDRDDALQAAVETWAADVAAGHDTGLFAWRRANVTELNRRARAWMQASGRLLGPELACPGGATYRAGDRVMALAPDSSAGLVTSERATVESADLASSSLVLLTDDGRRVSLSGEATGAERLGLAYATTVHRSQGSTTSRAHLFADGGGRELAYVAMSRAREGTHAWLVADDLAQAAEDLRQEWSTRRTPTWAIQTGVPAPTVTTREALAALADPGQARLVALALAQAKACGDALVRLGPDSSRSELADARAALRRAEQDLSDLKAGDGAYSGTEAGRAVSDLARAQATLTAAAWTAEHSPRWRERRAAAKESDALANQLAEAGQRWQAHVAPEAVRLQGAILERRRVVDKLVARNERQVSRGRVTAERGQITKRAANGFSVALDGYRDRLDGTEGHTLKQVTAAIRRALRVPAAHYQPSVSHDPGPDL